MNFFNGAPDLRGVCFKFRQISSNFVKNQENYEKLKNKEQLKEISHYSATFTVGSTVSGDLTYIIMSATISYCYNNGVSNKFVKNHSNVLSQAALHCNRHYSRPRQKKHNGE